MLRPLPRLRVTQAARRRWALVAGGSAPGRWQALQTGVRVPQDGTIEVTAGTSGTGEAVYFDNLRVEQTGGLIVQEQHPYAYGAPLPGLSYTVGTRRYRYGYQGQYAEHDDETGFESFELRLYNSRIGRWLSYDPEGQYDSPYVGMGNNPVSGVDPDGGFSGPPGGIRYLTGTTLNSFGGSFLGSTARASLSAGARIGLQAASSASKTWSFYKTESKAYNHMYSVKTAETSAFLLRDSKGANSVLVLPYSRNTEKSSVFDYSSSEFNKSDMSTYSNMYNSTYVYKGITYKVLAKVHTHLSKYTRYGGPSGTGSVNVGDPSDELTYKADKITTFVIGEAQVSKLDPNKPFYGVPGTDPITNYSSRSVNKHFIGKTVDLLKGGFSLFSWL